MSRAQTAILVLVAVLALGTWPAPGHATLEQYMKDMGGARVYDPYPDEWDRLPRYCRVKLGEDRAKFASEIPKWREVLATPATDDIKRQGFSHLHHYCAGLVALLRIKEGRGKPSALLSEAEGQFSYMLRHTDPSFVLMHEVYTNYGFVKMKQGDEKEALRYFRKAIKAKPSYPKPYLYIAEMLEKKNRVDQAIKVLKLGLRKNPNAVPLQVRLSMLTKRAGGEKAAPPPQPDAASPKSAE